MTPGKTPQDIIAEAQEELRGGGFLPKFVPTWHPYYWLGRLRAAEEIESDRVRRGDQQPPSNPTA